MTKVPHPASVIPVETVNSLRNAAKEAELLKHLHPLQLEIIHAQKWFNLFVPVDEGGLQLTLPQALKLEEALAWIDGALGWTVTLCSGAAWFIGFLDTALAKAVFADEHVCLAGSGNTSGNAVLTPGGFLINGSWDYATGSNAATAFTANCTVEENGEPVKNSDGSPLIYSFLFFRREVNIHKNWNRIGMIATGSNSFSVSNLLVPSARSFTIKPGYAVLKDAVFQYPFLQLAETTLAVNNSGMAIRFLDLCQPLISSSKSSFAHDVLVNGRETLENKRQVFYTLSNRSWEQCAQNAVVDNQLLQQLSVACKGLAHAAREVVDQLYPYCGMQAADPGTEINRVWRNLHTASQHRLLHL